MENVDGYMKLSWKAKKSVLKYKFETGVDLSARVDDAKKVVVA